MTIFTRKSWTFHQKIFFASIGVFATFLLILAPFSEYLIKKMVKQTLSKTSKVIEESLKQCPDASCMMDYLKQQEQFVFFRVSLIDQTLHVLYDTHPSHQESEYSEIEKAFKQGKAFYIGYSKHFNETFVYSLTAFTTHGLSYVLRVSMPFSQIEILIQQFRIGLYTINTLFMITFLIGVGWIFYRLSRPIRQITDTIRLYAEGQVDILPKIKLHQKISGDFDTLARTLNSLSDKIRQHIRFVIDERNEKESILDSLMEGVIALNREGVVRYTNPTFAKMVGLSRRDLFGHRLAAISSPQKEPLARVIALIKVAQEQEMVVTDSIDLDSKVFLDLIVVPKPFKSGAIVVVQDKSSQRQVVEMGKDFIANASHELRTPITIIKGFAETLQDLKEISPSMLTEITEKIVRNCIRMEALVKNLLTLADLENIPQSNFQPCDLSLLADNCLHYLQGRFPEAVIKIEKTKDHIVIDADAGLLELALMNLLENGVKYSKPPAHLTIRLEEKSREVLLSVQDQGIGIPPDDVPLIFGRFYTVNKAHSRHLGGAGLGLSIVKTIVESHEGTLSVVSQLGQGTTFTMTLPKKHRWEDGGPL